MAASTVRRHETRRHEIGALLRAHLAAASGIRHRTRHCAVCHRLLRLAMGPAGESGLPETPERPGDPGDTEPQAEQPQPQPGSGSGSGSEDKGPPAG
ncbi:DUF6274 family protein [Streptomyces sp. NPDC055078]